VSGNTTGTANDDDDAIDACDALLWLHLFAGRRMQKARATGWTRGDDRGYGNAMTRGD
jgi:hypothetical protein